MNERIAITDQQFFDALKWADSNIGREKARNDFQLLSTILFYTGARISEALALRVEDVRVAIKRGVLKMPQHKKRDGKVHFREIPIAKPFAKLLKKYLKVRVDISGKEGYLFHPQGRVGIQPSIDGFTNRFNSLLLKAIPTESGEKITSHSFRYRASSQLYKKGVKDEHVSRFLGHSMSSTAQKHYYRVGKDVVRKQMKVLFGYVASQDVGIADDDIERSLIAG
jgi:integrase